MRIRYFLFILLFLLLPFSTFAATGNATQITSLIGSNSTASKTDVFNFLRNTYLLGLSLVGLAALYTIVRGGLNYILAGDNPGSASKGRERIRNALIGVALAAFSYAILYTINPDLVQLRIEVPTNTIAP